VIRFLADENFNNAILRGLRRRLPAVDFVRAQDVGLTGVDDPELLEWAAREGRVLLTHDVATIPHFAYQRIEAGLPMAGVCEVTRSVPIGRAIEDLMLGALYLAPDEWANQVRYLPL